MAPKKLLAAVFSMALVAAACGDDTDEPDIAAEPTEDTSEPAETEEPTETDEPTETEEPEETETDEPAGGTAADPSLESVKIGWLNQDEGVPSFPGSTAGADVAIEYVNEEMGGIDGHPVELVKCSPGLDEASNQACAQEMANNAEVNVVSSGFLLGSPPIYPVLQAAGKPILGGSPLNISDFTEEGAYFFSPGTPGIIGGMPEFVLNHLEGGDATEKAAILISDNDAGRAALPIIQPELEAAGIAVTVVPVPDAATDLIGPITAAGAADADVFFPLVAQPACIQVANALESLSLDVTVVTTQLCADAAVREAANDGIQGWYVGGNGPSPKQGMGIDDDLDTYLEAFETYGDPEEASLSGATGGFANIVTLAEIGTEIGFDDLSAEAWMEAIAGYTDAMFLGAPSISCPGPVLPTLCTTEYKMLQVSGDGFEPAGPDFINSIENN